MWKQWTNANIEAAIKAVAYENILILQTAKDYGVPVSRHIAVYRVAQETKNLGRATNKLCIFYRSKHL